jgi:4-amino-4-deoxy-L-arabinose transferase-like glycosyltransferase
MHYVSLIVEFLRGRPAVMFWCAALLQAALWTFLPALFFSAPPGDVPILLAIGHEFELGSYLGPPLAFWLGELAFRLAGAFGLYALAQACIVLTYWAVFTLGRSIVGTRHAVLAVLLMAGIAAFALPSVDFGPAIMAAPFWTLALLHYWRIIGEDRRGYWFLLAVDLGLLLLSSYVGLILIALMLVFTPLTVRERRALLYPEPWAALLLLALVVFPYAWWANGARDLIVSGLQDSAGGRVPPGLWLAGSLIVTHLGLGLLVGLAIWPRKRRVRPPEVYRNPVAPLARRFVYFFAVAPALVAVAVASVTRQLGPMDRIAPLVVLSGLAVIVSAGDRLLLHRENLLSSTWLGLLVAPPALVVGGLVALPWLLGVDPRIAQPANAEGRFFAESYARRIGKPLQYVTGDPRVAPLVALGAPSRPHVYFAWAPDRSPWASADDVRAKGGVIVWPDTATGAVPPPLKALFPQMVPEVPRSFERPVQGFLPLVRLGWAVIRPPAP